MNVTLYQEHESDLMCDRTVTSLFLRRCVLWDVHRAMPVPILRRRKLHQDPQDHLHALHHTFLQCHSFLETCLFFCDVTSGKRGRFCTDERREMQIRNNFFISIPSKERHLRGGLRTRLKINRVAQFLCGLRRTQYFVSRQKPRSREQEKESNEQVAH